MLTDGCIHVNPKATALINQAVTPFHGASIILTLVTGATRPVARSPLPMCCRPPSGLKPAVKNRAAHGGEDCAARMVKTKADALGIGGQTPICYTASLRAERPIPKSNFMMASGRVKSGLKPAVKNRAAPGGEDCAARRVKTKAGALGMVGGNHIFHTSKSSSGRVVRNRDGGQYWLS